MSTADAATIARLRELSFKINELYGYGQRDQAFALLDQALAQSEQQDAAYFLFFQAKKLSYEGKHPQAEPLLRQALELRTADPYLLKNLGTCLGQQNRDAEAVALFDLAMELNPKDSRTWLAKGVSLSKLGREEEAIAHFDRALEFNPNNYNAWRQKGVSCLELGRVRDALRCYEQALELNPADCGTWLDKEHHPGGARLLGRGSESL